MLETKELQVFRDNSVVTGLHPFQDGGLLPFPA
jgi:hypothetical protein